MRKNRKKKQRNLDAVEEDAATMEDAVGADADAETEPNARYIQMEITSGRIAAVTQKKITVITLSKEEDAAKAEAMADAEIMADAVSLVDAAADPHQEKRTTNSSMEDPLNRWFQIHL